MLVNSLALNKSVIIDSPEGRIKITVLRMSPGQVRLGFDADISIPIYRQELLESIPPHREGENGPGND